MPGWSTSPKRFEATGDSVEVERSRKELRRRMHQPIPEQGQVAVPRGHGLLRLPCGTDQHHQSGELPKRGGQPMETYPSVPKPEGQDHLGTHPQDCARLVASPKHPPSLARSTLCRQLPKVEARCVNCARRALRVAFSNKCPYRDGSPPGAKYWVICHISRNQIVHFHFSNIKTKKTKIKS